MVVLVGEAELPMMGPALRELGVSVTIRVESRARSDVVPLTRDCVVQLQRSSASSHH